MNSAKLIYKDDFLIIKDFLCHQKDIYYNTSFNLVVKSACFSGNAPCEYDIKEFK